MNDLVELVRNAKRDWSTLLEVTHEDKRCKTLSI